ncbi:hypothetical protein [Aeromonas bivalvium]|uniref:hypothetical protein n=1 Tax=Aeromonas bivalvium TaxID=440079 RepID=UPI0038D2514C
MRIMPLLKATCLSLMLSACVAPLLMMGPSSQLMWALLKPLVGFDPNEVNLFEQPLIKDRMTALLGPNYDTTVSLLKTAGELQQEGPLFYVVSRYTPVPDLAQKAGLVWNSDTNQMAVKLLKGDAVEVFGEQLGQVTPSWPKEMAGWQTPASEAVKGAMTGSASELINGATQQAAKAVSNQASQAVEGASAAAAQAVTRTVNDAGKQAVEGASAAAAQAVTKTVNDAGKQATESASAAATQAVTKTVNDAGKQGVEGASAAATQAVTRTVNDAGKQAAEGASAAATQAVSKTVEDAGKQGAEAVSQALPTQDPQAAARASAEAELEALLK